MQQLLVSRLIDLLSGLLHLTALGFLLFWFCLDIKLWDEDDTIPFLP